jgi:hypothetical protein
VQFCINGSTACNNAGQYFVADFVAVKEAIDVAGEAYLDAVVIDTKLSQSTSLTPNQRVANGLGNIVIKSIPPNSLVKGQIPQSFVVDETVRKQSSIRKMWSDGNGNYQNVE